MPDRNLLTGIEVSGFKSAIEPVGINVRDLTILAGQNSAGKSTIIQPVLMCKQTLEKPFDPGVLSIDGPIVQFTSADQFISKTVGQGESEFTLTLKTTARDIRLKYTRAREGGISLLSMDFSQKGEIITWKEGDILSADSNAMPDELSSIFKPDSRLKVNPFGNLKFVVRRNRCTFSAMVDRKSAPKFPASFGLSPGDQVMAVVRNIIHLPGLRGNPERNYRIMTPGEEYPGNFNEYVASIISHWQNTQDRRLATLGSNMKTLGLTWKVETRRIDDTRAEILVGRLPAAIRGGARDTVSIADVGFGVSQTLPVLVALLAASPGQHVFIEQPEIHLHPKAQVALAEVFFQAVERGVRIIMETHSSLLVLAIQALVAERKIRPDQVSMNWFTRDRKGQTEVREAEIGDDGSYGDWPLDFGNIELDLQSRYMDSADQLHREAAGLAS